MTLLKRFFLIIALAAVGTGTAMAQAVTVGTAPLAGGAVTLPLTITTAAGLNGVSVEATLPNAEVSITGCTTAGTPDNTNLPADINTCNVIDTQTVRFLFSNAFTQNDLPSGQYGTIIFAENTGQTADLVVTVAAQPNSDACITAASVALPCTLNNGLIPLAVGVVTVGDANLGAADIGVATATQPVAINNGTAAGIDPTAYTFTGPYTVANGTCANPLGAAATCNLDVTCTPTAVGANPGTITLLGVTGTLSCTGNAPAGVVSVGNAAFGDIEINTTSGALNVNVSNNSGAAIDPTAFTLGGANAANFAVTAGTCVNPLTDGTSCDLSATCAPTAVGALAATVTVANVTGNLSCNGIDVVVPVGILSLTAGPAPAMMMTGDQATLTLGNTGTADLVVTTTGLVTGTDFIIVTDNCDTVTLAPTATCTVIVQYTGAAPATDTLNFTSADLAGGPLNAVAVPLVGGQPPIAIPTLSQTAMLVMGVLLAMLAMVGLRRQS